VISVRGVFRLARAKVREAGLTPAFAVVPPGWVDLLCEDPNYLDPWRWAVIGSEGRYMGWDLHVSPDGGLAALMENDPPRFYVRGPRGIAETLVFHVGPR
jgi:hypothetical protein